MSSDHSSAPAFDPADWARPFDGAAWCDVRRRSEVLPLLGRNVLLHAGPPFESTPPAAVRQAAVQALLFEGLAGDVPSAQAMLSLGEVRLLPAQDHGVVTPLAQVVSASMPVAVVGQGGQLAYAPLVEGPPPALRFGSSDPLALQRLREITTLGLERLAPLLRARPLALAPVVAQALAEGDECHGRTAAANQALLAALPGLDPADRQLLAASPGFVLTILMAAARCVLHTCPQGVAAAGGNGLAFGLRLHGEQSWRTRPATPPRGMRFPRHDGTEALGAIGDSAVLDFCGLGGQALLAAPALREEWAAVLPGDLRQQRLAVSDPASGVVSPAQVQQSGRAPLVNLAILDLAGEAGLIGRGVYSPDVRLFGAA